MSTVKAQDKNDSTFVFSGYIFSEDSVPVENAYLINYRNTKIVATDGTGRFSVSVQKDDSLMINHLSMQPLVIHPKSGKAASNIFYVKYRMYQIQTVSSKGNIENQNFEKNMQQIKTDLENLGLQHIKSPRGSVNNPYNPDKTSEGLTITPDDIFKLFRKKKKK
ncbi:MAG: hypothetical protein AB2L24_16430 [Mangrovibacterium sp.]